MDMIQCIKFFITITFLISPSYFLDKNNCILKNKWAPGTKVETFRNIYLKAITPVYDGNKSYNINNRFEMETTFHFKTPCGTMDYDPGLAIKNGTEAPDKAWPWQSIVYTKKASCGGVLIDAQWVLTAAHCVLEKNSTYNIKLGSRKFKKVGNEVIRTTKLILMHEEYEKKDLKNDIALIKMTSPLVFTDRVRPVCLPVYGQDFTYNDYCYATGFGAGRWPDKETLQQLKVYVVPDAECAYFWNLRGYIMFKGNICAGKVRQKGGVSHGDSGSPLSCKIGNKYYLAGVASWCDGNCTSVDQPDGYSKTTIYIDWIFHNIEKFRNT